MKSYKTLNVSALTGRILSIPILTNLSNYYIILDAKENSSHCSYYKITLLGCTGTSKNIIMTGVYGKSTLEEYIQIEKTWIII